MLTLENGVNALHEAGAKITSQRLAIIKCLEGRHDHPTAEAIFNELKPQYPTLSIATVYSTTRLLAKASVARVLTIDDKKVCFDPDTAPHGHFLCTECKTIIDVPFEAEMFKDCSVPGVHAVSTGELFLYGLCEKCAPALSACS